MHGELHIRLLGHIEVRKGEKRLHIGGSREHAILVMLALNAGAAVGHDSLIDAVYDANPPNSARSQIVTCVNRLRRFIGDSEKQIIVRAYNGYLLNPEKCNIDLLAFEDLVKRGQEQYRNGDTAAAGDSFAQALTLWQGTALYGVEGASVRQAAARLENKHLDVREQWLSLELDLGHHLEVSGELAALAAEHPFRESLQGLLMIAQHRCGRRAEALDTYRAARDRLVEELGVEPGAELQRLHHALLRGDAALGAPERADRRMDRPVAARPPFAGHAGRLRRPDHVPAVAVVTGMPGAGKTALALHWAHRLPDGRHGLDETHESPETAAVLDQFLRVLGVPAGDIPAGVHERAVLCRRLTSNRRLIIVLDDAHCSDQVQ
jgi:DNA-binding SARP family transcriptional activator